MDPQDLLSLFQRDIEDLVDDEYDDNVDTFEKEFKKQLLESSSLISDEAAVDRDWDEFITSTKDVENFIETVNASIASEKLDNKAIKSQPPVESSIDYQLLAAVSTELSVVEIDPDIRELLEEMLDAVERAAPLIAVVSQLSQQAEVDADLAAVNQLGEFNESHVAAEYFSGENVEFELLAESLRLEDSAKAAETKRLIELEEERLRQIDIEEQQLLQRELASKEARRLRREEEFKRAQVIKQQMKATTKIQCLVRRRIAFRLYSSLMDIKLAREEELLQERLQMEAKRLAEEQRIEKEKEQKRIDTLIAVKEGFIMINEDALSKEMRDWHAVLKEIIEMKAEDELSCQLRICMKEFDQKIEHQRQLARDTILLRDMYHDAIALAFCDRNQEYKSIWNIESSLARGSKATQAAKGNFGATGWGGSLGKSKINFETKSVISTGAKYQAATEGKVAMGDITTKTLTDKLIGQLCQPLSLLQESWRTLIQKAAGSANQQMRVVSYSSSGQQYLPAADVLTCTKASEVCTGTEQQQQQQLDPILAALLQWLQWSSQTHAKSAEQSMPTAARKDNANKISVSGEQEAVLSDKAIEVLFELGYGEKDVANLNSLKLSVEGLNSIDFVSSFKNIKDIEVNVNKLKHLRGLIGLSKLEQISAKDNAIEDIDYLSSCQSLKAIKLDSNQITSLAGVSTLPELVILTANTNYITSLPEMKCPQLQRLELYHNFISDVPLESLSHLKSLTHLDLGRNKLESICGSTLSSCPLLQSLILSQNQLMQLPVPLYLPNLKSFWCSANRLSDLRVWSETNNNVFLPMLEKLHLQDNQLESIEPGVFCTMPNLSQLDLSFNKLSTLRQISGLAFGLQPFALKQLQLQDNPISRTKDPTGVLNEREMREKLRSVFQWLSMACPGLDVLSNNNFAEVLAKENMSRHSSITSRNTANSNNTNNANSNNSTSNNYAALQQQQLSNFQDVIEFHDRSSKWPTDHIRKLRRAQSLSTSVVTSTISATSMSQQMLRAISFEEAVQLQAQAATQVLAEGCHEAAASENSEVKTILGSQIESYKNSSLTARRFIDVVNAIATEQNSWRARERCAAQLAAQQKDMHLALSDHVFVELMQQQVRYLEEYGAAVKAIVHDSARATSHLPISMDFSNHSLLLRFGGKEFGHQFISHFAYTAKSTRDPIAELQTVLQASLQTSKQAIAEAVVEAAAMESMSVVDDSAPRQHSGYRTNNDDGTSSSIIDDAHSAVTNLQKLYRGSRTRRLLSNALDNAKYFDEELESLFQNSQYNDAMKDIGLDDLLTAEELDPNWIHKRSVMAYDDADVRGINVHGADDDDEGDDEDLDLSLGHIAYGDLQRRRGSASRHAHAADENSNLHINSSYEHEAQVAPSQLHAWGTPPPSSHNHQLPQIGAKFSVASSPVSNGEMHSPRSMSSRPMSTSTDISYHGRMGSRMEQADENSIPTIVTGGVKTKHAVAEEWGINDPHLLSVLMKRNKRMRHFANAKELREKEKDPEIRLQKFLKSSNTTAGAGSAQPNGSSSQSGSFGGKPKTIRHRGGKSGGVVPPAWSLGEELEH